jgi:hypothetical protein
VLRMEARGVLLVVLVVLEAQGWTRWKQQEPQWRASTAKRELFQVRRGDLYG